MQYYQNFVKAILFTLPILSLNTTASNSAPSNTEPCNPMATSRSIDGRCNNLQHPEWGSTNVELIRTVENAYQDGLSEPPAGRPNPRMISQSLFKQGSNSIFNTKSASDYLWQFGQFLDHDLDLTESASPIELLPIPIPGGDPTFDPQNSSNKTLSFVRSIYHRLDVESVRQQVNQITSWIDGSQVYSSDRERLSRLRLNDGSGRLAFDSSPEYGDLLPRNDCTVSSGNGVLASFADRYAIGECLENEALSENDVSSLYVAGDIRANEQAGLTAMHTLFMREHNYQASLCSSSINDNIQARDDDLFECARRMVIAELQHITFNEFLAVLLGDFAPDSYGGYDSSVNPGITNEFATAAFRFGHSALSPSILRSVDGSFQSLKLKDAFFCSNCMTSNGGVDSILLGLAYQPHQSIDVYIVDDVRNLLFNFKGLRSEDLVSRNIQRGRDHGLPTYPVIRAHYGLSPVNSFSDIKTNEETRTLLRRTYRSVDMIDAWPGMLAETSVSNGLIGELPATIIRSQFTAIRSADRFWYENPGVLSSQELATVKSTRLSDIIRRNTKLDADAVPDEVFFAAAMPNSTPSTNGATSFAQPVTVISILLTLGFSLII